MQYEMNILNKVEAKLWFTIEVYKVIYYAWPVNASRFRCKFDLVATVTYLLALSRTLSFDTTCYACTLAATQSYLPCRISIELQGLYNFLKQQYCSMYSIKLLLMVFFLQKYKEQILCYSHVINASRGNMIYLHRTFENEEVYIFLI